MRRITHHHDGHGLTELCEVYAADDPHPVNGANHVYQLSRRIADGDALPEEWTEEHRGDAVYAGEVIFQRGPRHAPDSIPGVLDGCLLSILIDRMTSFQTGPFACDANDAVLGHLRAALSIMQDRADARAKRGVLERGWTWDNGTTAAAMSIHIEARRGFHIAQKTGPPRWVQPYARVTDFRTDLNPQVTDLSADTLLAAIEAADAWRKENTDG